jgi:hypothetical protein
MQALSAQLATATAARDWDRLAAAARALPAALSELAAHGPLRATEQAALAQLRRAHEDAEAACAHAAGELGPRLDEMRRNKQGWIAYALEATHTAGDRK